MLPLDLNMLVYNILYLIVHEEYSVREYAEHALSHLLPIMTEKLIKFIESQLV